MPLVSEETLTYPIHKVVGISVNGHTETCLGLGLLYELPNGKAQLLSLWRSDMGKVVFVDETEPETVSLTYSHYKSFLSGRLVECSIREVRLRRASVADGG